MPPVHSALRRPFSQYETRERVNFWKLHWLLFEVGTACLRKVFDTEFHPSTLEAILCTESARRKLYNVTHKKQWRLLYPAGGTPVTSQSFDITLMICVLKSLGGYRISDNLPFEKNHSIEEDLSRLHCYRNMFSHLPMYEIDDQTFEKWFEDISQVIENLGCPEWKEECEEVRMRSQETCQKGMKNLLLQLFLILHSKGHNIFSKISEKFWSYSATEQLCLIFSLLEVHFWIYPTIKTIWDEFQDSYYMNSDIKFFERTECQLQSDNQDPPYGDCFPWMSSATSTSPIKGSHILRIESKNGQYFIDEETDEKKTETETANNMIKIRCCCNLEKAGLCFMILFSHLDTRRYRHDHNTTNENSDDRYHYFTLRNNDGKTDIVQDHHDHNTTNENSDDIYHYFTLRNNDGQTNIVQDKEMTSTEEMQILFETNMRSNIYFSPQPVEFVPEAYSYTHSSYNTGHNLCNTVCVNKNLLN